MARVDLGIPPDCSAFELSAIKAAFKDPEGDSDAVEHMWLSEIEFDGDVIDAVLMNSPNQLTSVKEGDKVTLRMDQIEDWICVIGGRVYGGFTIQVLRAAMSPSELRSHDSAWGFDFGDPNRVNVVPNWKGETKNSLDSDAEHPMSENMAKGFAEAIERDRRGFFELGPSGLNTLHSLALGGSAACVKVLLEMGADPSMRTKKGKTARELAELMGWPRVAAMLRDAEAASVNHR